MVRGHTYVRAFQQIAAGIDVLPLWWELHRQPELWNQHTARTGGAGAFTGTDDIWCRFRSPDELVSPQSYAEPFISVMYPAWDRLPALRSIVFPLMARLQAVHLGAVLITRVPAGCQVAPHDDRGRWHAEHFTTKAWIPLKTNDRCFSTCGDDCVWMKVGEAWNFDNLQTHATINDGDDDRITLIVSLRCE
jgi:hypothetical protein